VVELAAPRSGKGVLIVLGAVLILLLALYATMLPTIIVGALLITLALYLFYTGAVRVDRLLKGVR
jgi:membrane-bound ClpP family serine protease